MQVLTYEQGTRLGKGWCWRQGARARRKSRPTQLPKSPHTPVAPRRAEQPAACPPPSQLSMPSLPPVNFAFLMSAACGEAGWLRPGPAQSGPWSTDWPGWPGLDAALSLVRRRRGGFAGGLAAASGRRISTRSARLHLPGHAEVLAEVADDPATVGRCDGIAGK